MAPDSINGNCCKTPEQPQPSSVQLVPDIKLCLGIRVLGSLLDPNCLKLHSGSSCSYFSLLPKTCF